MKTLIPTNIKKDFPIFERNPDLVYLDSTATALKPRCVIDACTDYYQNYSANVYRGIYAISELATKRYEEARQITAQFIHANSSREVIFTRGTTEGLNLLAYTIGRERMTKGAEIVISIVEHHSNFVPWQQLAAENEALLKVLDCDGDGRVPLYLSQEAEKIITKKTVLVSLFYVSNVLGTINPIAQICQTIKRINPQTIIVVDAAQAAPSIPIDVQALGCDFLVFSGHKVGGPTGVGVLWGKEELLKDMPPFNFGGEMIEKVTLQETTFKAPPHKFEAGTPPIAEAIGLGAALQYLTQVPLVSIRAHEQRLWEMAYNELKRNKHIRILGPQNSLNRTGILSFVHDKIHPHDLAQILAADSICIRAGHHCAMPLHTALKLSASARATFYIYNTERDIEQFLKGIHQAEKIFL